MKNTIIFFLLASVCAAIFVNCKNNSSTSTDETVSDSTATNTADISKIEGFWVNNEYWQALENTKSPAKASYKAAIGSIHITQDSVWKAMLSFNWHEGMDYVVQPDGGKYHLLNVYETPPKMEHEIELLPEGNLKMDTLTFIRLTDGKTGDDAISHHLVGGTYRLKGGNEVKLNPDGTVTGLDDYTHYDVLLDYVTEATTFDQLLLSKGEDQMPDFYGYQTKDGKLTVFNLDCKTPGREPCQEYKMGKVKYELVKSN